MKYKFEIQEGDCGCKRLILPKNIKLVEYVFADMECFSELIFYSAIEKVLTGLSNYEEIAGNMCGLQISRDITIVSSNFVEDGIQNECEIETSKLFELINIWIKLNKENFESGIDWIESE